MTGLWQGAQGGCKFRRGFGSFWGIYMSTDATLVAAVLVYVLLAGMSMAFNGYIDRQPLSQRPDGMTAAWVAVGVLYTLVWLLWPWLALLEGVVAALVLLAVYVSAFVAAGLPMLVGDASRSHRVRRTQGAIDAARAAEYEER